MVYYKESGGWELASPVVTELNSLYNFHHQLQRQQTHREQHQSLTRINFVQRSVSQCVPV